MAKIKIKNKNSLPKGYTIRKGKCIKTYAAGGATVRNTLSPIDRDAANLEAEKNEMVLTDTSGDGVFELYNVGGKRHSEGGTPLNLPDQSFVYSDTRGMLLTKDEMLSLGIDQKKRITPAAAAKKFPLNKYIEILEDETSDKIAVETAEQMINKNKIMLSQIAFIQESKKDFENGLPLAAFPYLMSKGINPQEFQQKIMEMKAEKEGQGPGSMPTHTMPDGTVHPGATHEEYMAMQQQGMPPQGTPPMGPPQGGMPPQGMIPPAPPTNAQAQNMMMGRYGGALNKFEDGGPTAMDNLLGLFSGFKKSSYSVAPPEGVEGDLEVNPSGDQDPSLTACPSFGNPPPSATTKLQEGGVPEELKNMMEIDLITKCKNSLCEYDEWRFAFRLKDTPEIRFMYESYKTKAIDKMRASGTDTDIMPGHENLKTMPYGNMPNMPMMTGNPKNKSTMPMMFGNPKNKSVMPMEKYGTETGQPMVPQMGVPEGYVRDQNPLGLPGYRYGGMYEDEAVGLSTFVAQEGVEVEKMDQGVPLDPLVAPYEQNPYYRNLKNKLALLNQEYQATLNYPDTNPNNFTQEKQEDWENHLNILQNQMMNLEYELMMTERKLVLESSMLDIETPTPNIKVADVSEYTGVNPAMEGAGMMMARNGMELPRYDLGDHVCVGDNCTDGGEDEHNDQKHDLQNAGIDAHMQFQNMINSETFAMVKQGWLDAYRRMEESYKAIKQRSDDGEEFEKGTYEAQILKNPPVLGKSNEELINGFMAMNQKLLQAQHAGIKPEEWGQKGENYKKICKRLGWGDDEACSKGNERGNEANKIWQGMFVAMQHLKAVDSENPEIDQFFGNITTNLEGKHQPGNTMVDPFTKKPMSHIDGVIGWTSAGQGMGVENEITERIITHDVPCDEETRKAKEKECYEKAIKDPKSNWHFDLESCSCKTAPGDPEIKETPPYMTFPQDDLRLQNAIDTKWARNLYLPQRMHEDAIIPEVAYQDPQAQIQANLSLAGQMANMDPENASYYMGLISDKNNKAISDVANTNIKIFDNHQARVANALSANQTANTGYKDEYNTRVATALNNWDNTRIADNQNITDTQVDRMDHADKLFAINQENPNFYYDAQRHRNVFYNPLDMFVEDEINTNVSMADAVAACREMGFTSESQIMACAKQMQSGNTNTSPQREDIVNKENKEEKTETEVVKHGKETHCSSCMNDNRRKELARSKKALRDWIFGI